MTTPFSSRSVQRGEMRDEMALRMRRPPTEYVSLLSQSERDFRAYVDSLESHPAFGKLLEEGVIAKVRLRGKIPREKYESFMDEQMMHFLRFYGVVNHAGWERDFLTPHASERVMSIAERYGTPVGETLRFLRYISATGADNLSQALAGPPQGDDRRPSMEETIAGGEMVDLSEIIEKTREFVEKYEVSEQEFLNLVLGGESTAEELATHFGCSLFEAQELLEAADRVYLAQSSEGFGETTKREASPLRPVVHNEEPVAYVSIGEDDEISIQFHQDSVYTQRYRIKPQVLKEIKKSAPEEARDLLMRARYINQRLSALSRLITTLCEAQKDYLKSGDARQLKPLAQAALARDLGEHPSMVSRLIRKKFIETPWGKIELIFLCQSKTDVVARLIAQHPQLTDQEVVMKLREDYDCFIARRTVAYHRGKRLRRNKRRKTAKETSEK